jgi:hypothetical protein
MKSRGVVCLQHKPPPRCDERAEMSAYYLFKFSLRGPTSEVSGSLRSALTYLFTLRLSAFGDGDVAWPERISLVSKRSIGTSRLRNFDTEHPFSFCYEQQFAIAWKASLTCTPPPICASTQGSQTALIRRAMNAASQQRNTRRPNSRNAFVSLVLVTDERTEAIRSAFLLA